MIPDSFTPVNVTDTCAVWHLIGSATLFDTARRTNVSFVITNTVFYECFIIRRIDLPIDDLQDLLALARQLGLDKRLGQGEISCAALARRWGAAVLTDNRRDFRAIFQLVDGRLQTTPRLLGWLYLDEHFTDRDVEDVVSEHRECGGQMSDVYKRAYYEACEKRLQRHMSTNGAPNNL